LGFAALYLDDDHNLKQLKELVKTLVTLETDANQHKNDLETTLSILHFSDVIRNDQFAQSVEGQIIQQNINRFETDLYRQFYEKEVNQLDRTIASANSIDASVKLKGMLQNTSCLLCKNRGFEAINSFGNKIEEHSRQVEITRNDSIVNSLQPWIYIQLEKHQLAKTNLELSVGTNNSTESSKYLIAKLNDAERDLGNIKDIIKVDIKSKDFATVNAVNQKLIQYRRSVDDALTLVCQLKPDLCQLVQQQKSTVSDRNLQKVFEAADSLVRQTNIFISIFEFQLVQAQTKIVTDDLKLVCTQTDQKLSQLRVTNDIVAGLKDDFNTYSRMEVEINRLIRDISDLLSVLSRDEEAGDSL
jgi:hypothetical protein